MDIIFLRQKKDEGNTVDREGIDGRVSDGDDGNSIRPDLHLRSSLRHLSRSLQGWKEIPRSRTVTLIICGAGAIFRGIN